MSDIAGSHPDPPACPLLGLAADPRSHFTYPHPGHRCFASGHPGTADAHRQTAYCLSPDFPKCDRFRKWLALPDTKRPPTPSQPQGRTWEQGSTRDTPKQAPPTTVIYVFREGDSLNRIAARFGLTVGEILSANAFIQNEAPTDGTRLVIPRRAAPPTPPRP